jgi:hypothetical protein
MFWILKRFTAPLRRKVPVTFFLLSIATAAGAVSRREAPSRLEEISPLIQDIELIKGDPFIEVFIKGSAHLSCYDVREFVVEKKADRTLIIPRFRRSDSEKPCKLGLKEFRDKAADLDPANPASYRVEALGFRGWSRKILPGKQ